MRSGSVALVAAASGDKDAAFKFLEQAVDDHSTALASFAADPRLDSLRSDRRFKDLQKRVGI